ncbi:hypothetical protein [Roseovarius sp.]|uniref:3'-5' exonuclease n=1 Tax=Roseovarius sp. TaxID=1486281 RepID=UPI00262A8825|nr:hypothetical protein [Roseovarius sp.]
MDFEASSLSDKSWPIEVGLSWLDSGEIRTWSPLIRPAVGWNLSERSAQSAAIHGIPLESLQDAPPVFKVTEAFLSNLAGKIPVSDAPEFETRWLSRRFDASGLGGKPAVEDYHGVTFASFSGLALDMLYETLERRPAPHRAGLDSARLAAGWRKALQ